MKKMKHVKMRAPKMVKVPMAASAAPMMDGDTGMGGGMPPSMPGDTPAPQSFKHGGHVAMHKAAHGGHKHMSSTTKHGHKPMHRA